MIFSRIGMLISATLGALLGVHTFNHDNLQSMQNFKQSNVIPYEVNKNYLFGITELSWQEYSWDGIEWEQSHKLYKNLGVKSIRFWAHSTMMLFEENVSGEHIYKVNKTNYRDARLILDDLLNEDYQIIGMSHTNFHSEYQYEIHGSSPNYKPRRNLQDPRYLRWLDDYQKSWKALVESFPEITYWEIDNEINNDDFMCCTDGYKFTLEEKAAISYDMLYHASLGIHEGNKNAITVLGGLIMENATTFLEKLYDYIQYDDTWPSNNAYDYFQVGCWHPYYVGEFDNGWVDRWVNDNNAIYNVIKTREGGDKKVFCTEAGFNDYLHYIGQDKSALYLKEMYIAARDRCPYIEAMHYYRMYDVEPTSIEQATYNRYGLFTDPKTLRWGVDELDKDVGHSPSLASPKPAAFAYQELAGGIGDLWVYANHIKYE